MTFKREITFSPAFDKRNPDPHKNYGIHGVDMRWYVKGPKGAVQFVVYTGWMLDHVEEEMAMRSHHGIAFSCTRPTPSSLSYHSPKPLYEGQTSMGPCDVIGCDCYYDG